MAKKKYHQIGAGWLKSHPNSGEYVSALAEEKKLKLFVQLENEEVIQVKSFAMYTNDKKNSPNAPDVRFVFTTEE